MNTLFGCVRADAKPALDTQKITQTLIDHQYVFKEPIGQGGFATVFKITSLRYDQDFVVKVSQHNGSVSATEEKEIQTLINLAHPHIISMYEFFTDSSYLYIVLEYCPGGSLSDIIKSTGPMKPPQLYQICRQICLALKHCHDNNVAHRDIKPGNILIDAYGRPKLADFGLSGHYTEGSLVNSRAGSRPFMSPEIISGRAYDPFKSDVWALGVTFYWIATGRYPWNMTSLKEMELSINIGTIDFQHTRLDNSFAQLIRKMTEVKPKQRATIAWVLDQELMALVQPNTCRYPGMPRTGSVSNLNSQWIGGPGPAASSRQGVTSQLSGGSLSLKKTALSDLEDESPPVYGGKQLKLASCGSVLSFNKTNLGTMRRTPTRMNIQTFAED